uniref:MADF domain-containing protein n=1 Tax=Cacopsylla melanoneura TaxID=428564 RepID=A0A8D8T027_9HEMI
MNKIDNEQLISLVEARPALWDKHSDDYKDKNLKSECWREICLVLNEDFNVLDQNERREYEKQIHSKWAGLRDSWVKKNKEQMQEKATGFGTRKSRPYIYDQQLSFLRKVYSEAPNVVTVVFDEEDVNSIDKYITPDEHDQHNLDSGVQRPSTEKRKIPSKYDELEYKMMKFFDHQMKESNANATLLKMNTYEENHHLSFFKGILPSLNMLDDDQTLEFQAGVISLIQKIKYQTRGSNSSDLPYHEHYKQ